MRILIVMHDAPMGVQLRDGLKDQGHMADWLTRLPESAHASRLRDYDIVLMDEVFQHIAESALAAEKTGPVLAKFFAISPQGELKAMQMEGRLNAADVSGHPDAETERYVLSRVRHLLKLDPHRTRAAIQAGDLHIDTLRRRVSRAGVPIELTRKEYALLSMLASKPGNALSRTELLTEVWSARGDTSENLVDVTIRRLRNKIDQPFPTKLIHNVWGVGYRLEPEAATTTSL